MLQLSKLLLSNQGSIEVQGQLGLMIVTDERDNVESIARLFEAYHAPNPSESRPRTASNRGSDNSETAAIRAVLDAQAAAWNGGDIPGYMDGYDRSPKTEFVGGTASLAAGKRCSIDTRKVRHARENGHAHVFRSRNQYLE